MHVDGGGTLCLKLSRVGTYFGAPNPFSYPILTECIKLGAKLGTSLQTLQDLIPTRLDFMKKFFDQQVFWSILDTHTYLPTYPITYLPIYLPSKNSLTFTYVLNHS
jgi:hypothetical protein